MPLSRIVLTSRRSISLVELRMSSTYGGLLVGHPHKRVNDSIIASRRRTAEDAYPGFPVHLIPPPRDYPDRLASPAGPVEELPDVACIGLFHSWEIDPAHDSGWYFSALTIVWFQPTPDIPSEDGADHGLRDIPWDELAQDFEE